MRCGLAVMLMMLIAAVMASGCAATRPASPDPLAAAPEDFTLEVVVRCGREMPQSADVHLRPGQFIFLPDGSLRYAAGPPVEGRLPDRTRTLTRRQVAELWALTRQSGLADPASGAEPVNFNLIEPPRDGVVYLIGITGNDRRWAFGEEAGAGEEPDPAAVQLIRHLAELAWAGEQLPGRITIIPRRYDLGPDPYARYRRP